MENKSSTGFHSITNIVLWIWTKKWYENGICSRQETQLLNAQFQEEKEQKNKAASETGRNGGKIFRACDSSRRDDVPESWQITQLLADVDLSCRVGRGMQQPIYRSRAPRSVA